MGNCKSSLQADEGVGLDSLQVAEVIERKRRNKTIDRELKELEKRLASEAKILLLGAGESGKTTVLKMKVIHGIGFTNEETEGYRRQCFTNLWEAMRVCLETMQERGIRLADNANREHLYLFEEVPLLEPRHGYPDVYRIAMKRLWDDAGVQTVIEEHGIYVSIPDNMSYLYHNLDRLFQPGFVPTYDDILRVRGQTTGVHETIFAYRSLTYKIFDVGGQRSERRKWIHYFENVTAVLFLVALSGYDQGLIEDRDSNQVQEALMLFDAICNSTWFVRTSMILFLNKMDIFTGKVLTSPVSSHFPDYKGKDGDLDAAREYFRQRFTTLNRSSSKQVYCHFTTAVDTTLIKVVMISVQDSILLRNLAFTTF